MPLDVFFEVSRSQASATSCALTNGCTPKIASHLMPIDIFHLSHVSKQMRTMLLSRTARFVWEAARENVDPPLPECPEDMSEPMYAYLVFGKYCLVRHN